MRHSKFLCLFVGLVATAGCSRQESVSCNTDPRYVTARSAPPVQIPDDLSPPNDRDALRLPPDVGAGARPTVGPCLQSPPSFFGESRPFQLSSDDDAAAPAAPAPAERSAPAVDASDRVIDN
jgi:hypothetical protein